MTFAEILSRPGWGGGASAGEVASRRGCDTATQAITKCVESLRAGLALLLHPIRGHRVKGGRPMAKRILVAVDRTTPPYALLDLVGDVMRGGSAAVRLLHVAPVPDSVVDAEGRTIVYADQETARVHAEAFDALRAFEVHLGRDDVESTVRFGDPVVEILREAEEFGADLIAMPAVCHTGVRGWLFGSVADKVARRAPMPVLLLRPAA
jgi:nucleotide-binding universal stress UspA family protein